VWGNNAIPFVVQYAGCQMCRGHSENGSWHDGGVRKCHNAFLEAYTFGDNQASRIAKGRVVERGKEPAPRWEAGVSKGGWGGTRRITGWWNRAVL
jgi:hypothetical protein